jgi:hypothetical protein
MKMHKSSHKASTHYISPAVYLGRVVRDVFDEFFANRGAFHVSCNESNVVRYERQDWFAEAIYLPSDGPQFSPRVEIGVLPEVLIDPRRNRIDVLHTLPEGSELRRYNFMWKYTNEHEARLAFTKVRVRIMEVYIDPFLNDSPRLRRLLEDRCRELDQQSRMEADEHNQSIDREAAQSAFSAGDYESAVHYFSRIPAEALLASEKKKLEFARKRR